VIEDSTRACNLRGQRHRLRSPRESQHQAEKTRFQTHPRIESIRFVSCRRRREASRAANDTHSILRFDEELVERRIIQPGSSHSNGAASNQRSIIQLDGKFPSPAGTPMNRIMDNLTVHSFRYLSRRGSISRRSEARTAIVIRAPARFPPPASACSGATAPPASTTQPTQRQPSIPQAHPSANVLPDKRGSPRP